jgi:hypothetical protein
MLQKSYECREGETEEWKQNWDDVFLNKVKRERKRKETERKRKKRERKI